MDVACPCWGHWGGRNSLECSCQKCITPIQETIWRSTNSLSRVTGQDSISVRGHERQETEELSRRGGEQAEKPPNASRVLAWILRWAWTKVYRWAQLPLCHRPGIITVPGDGNLAPLGKARRRAYGNSVLPVRLIFKWKLSSQMLNSLNSPIIPPPIHLCSYSSSFKPNAQIFSCSNCKILFYALTYYV